MCVRVCDHVRVSIGTDAERRSRALARGRRCHSHAAPSLVRTRRLIAAVKLVPTIVVAYDFRVSDEPRVTDVEDLATARTLIATLQGELARVQRENASLRHQLDLLCQRLFGKKSERVSPDQLRLAFAQLANEPGAASDPIEMDSGERPGRPRRPLAPT